jgi:uncharacterized protein YlxW (UPF0749 family)
VLVGVFAAALAFVAAIQVRSQAEVERTLAGEDPTTLAFLIDDLHSANDQLGAEISRLQNQQAALRQNGGTAAGGTLAAEVRQLQVVEGLAPARGPGVVVTIDAALQALDLQDALNNLRISGAEAITVNGQRVITGTPITDAGGRVLVAGVAQRRPWTIVAIGDPAQLAPAADTMTKTLQSDPRVTVATWRSEPDLQISATVKERPLVYGTPG